MSITASESEQAMRVFIGLPVPESLKNQYESLPRNGIEAKWHHPDDLHITLKFLGFVTPEVIPEIINALSSIRRAPFTIVTKGMGVFEKEKKDYVLYGDIESRQKLTALFGAITDKLVPLGFDLPTRSFTPHITFARLKQDKGLDRYIKIHAQKIHTSWTAKEFYLYQTGEQLEGHEQKYRSIANFSLY